MIYKNRPSFDVKDPNDIAIEKSRGGIILVQHVEKNQKTINNKSVVKITSAQDVDRLIEALKCYRGSKFPSENNRSKEAKVSEITEVEKRMEAQPSASEVKQ